MESRVSCEVCGGRRASMGWKWLSRVYEDRSGKKGFPADDLLDLWRTYETQKTFGSKFDVKTSKQRNSRGSVVGGLKPCDGLQRSWTRKKFLFGLIIHQSSAVQTSATFNKGFTSAAKAEDFWIQHRLHNSGLRFIFLGRRPQVVSRQSPDMFDSLTSNALYPCFNGKSEIKTPQPNIIQG